MFGWLSPQGNFTEVDKYGHIKSLKEIKDVSGDLLDFIETKLDNLNSIYESCRSLITEGEHPEWPRYEMAQDSIQYDIWKKMIDSGFVRVGSYQSEMCFEGTGTGLANIMQKCKDLAEQHGKTPTFERQK